jgi:transketolase
VRNEFVAGIAELAERDDRVLLLTGDLGYTVVEAFADRFPDRFVNVGVAEQNMIGVATGLAEAGFVPFVYSIATFASMRGYEFVRNGPVLHELPVRIVGVGGGLDYGHNGVTHYALEDVALMRAQPGLAVIAPADPGRAVSALAASAGLDGPVYFRLGRESSALPERAGGFELGRAAVLGDGSDVALVALGTMAGEVLAAAEALEERGVSATVVLVETVSPAPLDDLAEALERCPLVITVEAHYLTGGLGSLVAEVVAERRLDCRLVRRGVDVVPRALTGTTRSLLRAFGLTAEQLVEAVVEDLQPAGH